MDKEVTACESVHSSAGSAVLIDKFIAGDNVISRLCAYWNNSNNTYQYTYQLHAGEKSLRFAEVSLSGYEKNAPGY